MFLPGDLCPWMSLPGESLSRGSLSGGSLSREGDLSGGSLFGGVTHCPDQDPPKQRPPDRDPLPWQRPPCTVKSGRYASYWNVFLFFSVNRSLVKYSRCLNSETKFRTDESDDRSSFMTGARCTAGSPVRASICADAASPFTTDLQAKYTRAPVSIQHVQVGTYKYLTYTPVHASI